MTEPGDFTITGFFGIHYRNDSDTKRPCGKINQQTGIMMFEALRYAVNQINKNMSLLFGQRLGYSVYDTCRSTNRMKEYLSRVILTDGSPGLIGPATSDESILCSPVLDIFNNPVVSYYATSMDLENRGKYGNFFRTVPSDRYQVFALLDIVRHFNWTYISTVNSHGNYGQRGTDYFISMVGENGICIAVRNVLPENPSVTDYKNSIKELMSDSKSRVVILITTAEDTKGLLSAAKGIGLKQGRFIWISSTSWATHTSLLHGLEDVADGALILNYDYLGDYGFGQYFLNLSYKNGNYGWFKEFWEDVFACTFSPGKNNLKEIACTGNETMMIGKGYNKFTSVKGVIEAVNTQVCFLRRYIQLLCPVAGINRTICIQSKVKSTFRMRYLGSFVLQLMKKSSYNCTGTPGAVSFDANGGVNGYFEILYLRRSTYSHIGFWRGSSSSYSTRGKSLNIQSDILWDGNSSSLPVSTCSRKCKAGEISAGEPGKPICCWDCIACGENEFVLNNTCKQCPPKQRPTPLRISCVAVPLVYVSLYNNMPITILILTVIGMVMNSFVLGMFIKHRNTKIVKASGIELCYVVLAGTYLCFMSPGAFLSRPSPIICGLRRFIASISLTTVYTPLFLKTNRLYRIFKSARSSIRRPVLISPRSQILICISLIGLQALLGITWTLGDRPVAHYSPTDQKVALAVVCTSDVKTLFLNLSPCFVLMAACTWFAFKTRKFPKNFNEAQSIGVTMYLSCLLWAIFIPLYLWARESSDRFLSLYVISIFCDTIGFFNLIGLFGQKIMLLIYPKSVEPEENATYDRFSTLDNGDSSMKLRQVRMRRGSLDERKDRNECRLRKLTCNKYTSTFDLLDERRTHVGTLELFEVENIHDSNSIQIDKACIEDA